MNDANQSRKLTQILSLQEQEAVRNTVREGYARIASSQGQSCCGPSSCCGADSSESASALASAIGYDLEELANLPEGANMGLSCGNPVALASLQQGDVVVDLGSGGGFDVFLAGRKVGPTGRAIGVDMTPEMLQRARQNLTAYHRGSGLDTVEFRLGEIEHLPLADASADVIISNCVINLSPEKAQVWREMARVLKPGGRVAVSDLALLQPLPEAVASMVEARVGCVAGAVLVSETERMAAEAGLTDITVQTQSAYLDALVGSSDPLLKKIQEALPPGSSPSDYVTSLAISAIKPRS